MSAKWIWLISVVARRIWFRASLFSVLAVATALVAIVAAPYIPSGLSAKIGADAVDNILGVIASSMLTVTTFSLSTMVAAFSAATTNVTPRATKLVMEDRTTHNVLATFIGSFLFSLVGIVALSTGAYGEQGRIILFGVTIMVIVLIVVTLLRWIDHLSRLGRVTETTERVEEATLDAIRHYMERPCLGGNRLPARDQMVRWAHPIVVDRVGYVQHVDAAALDQMAEDMKATIAIEAIPGKLVAPFEPIAWLDAPANAEQVRNILSCFTISDTRTFEQDPRFGASVLAEIASRALSAALNDPGTAIDVISRALRVLSVWAEAGTARSDAAEYPRLYVEPIRLADLFDDLFTPIARDGAGILEVGVRLQKAFRVLSNFPHDDFRENAARHSKLALARAQLALTVEDDKVKLRRAARHADAAPNDQDG